MKKFFVFFLLISLTFFTNISLAQKDAYSRETYDYVSSFDGTPASTDFNNTSTADISVPMNFLLTLLAVSIVILIVFRVIQGAVIKGTLDNIYQQTKGRNLIQNAGIALVIFIFSYAILSFINPRLTGWTLTTNYVNTAIRRTYNPEAVCNPNEKYTNTNIMDMLMQDEGNRTSIYLDSEGNRSIGVGFNLERADKNTVKNDLLRAGISDDTANRLLAGDRSATITQEQIKKLLDADFEAHKKMAINFAGGQSAFDSHPENIRNILINMTFNMGAGGIASFKNLKTALDAKDYNGVAREIVDSRYCTQVGGRCSRLANLASPQYCVEYQKQLAESRSLYDGKKMSATQRCKIALSIKSEDLKPIQGDYKLLKDRADAFLRMKEAAKRDGVDLVVSSAYRSDSHQITVCREVCGQDYCDGAKKCAKACQIGGGGSNHSTGDAVDLQNGCKNGQSNSICINNPVYIWMEKNGKDYGFIQNATIKASDAVHYSSTGG